MIDDALDEYATRQAIYAAHTNPPLCNGDIDPALRDLLQGIDDETAVIRACWGTWNTDERHDAVNALHDRWQDADTALMDAVRLTDFNITDQPIDKPIDKPGNKP